MGFGSFGCNVNKYLATHRWKKNDKLEMTLYVKQKMLKLRINDILVNEIRNIFMENKTYYLCIVVSSVAHKIQLTDFQTFGCTK